jgi:protease I
MTSINQSKIVILATDGFEKSELMVPLQKLREKGAAVDVASIKEGEIRSWDKSDWGETVPVDKQADAVRVEDYDAIVIPGGQINPDLLRVNEGAVRLVREFVKSGKPVAAVCHGPWLLVEADALKGRRATSYHSIKTDVKNAGAEWLDEEVVVDEGIITSRSPKDLEAFVGKIVEEVEEGRHQRQAA